MRLGDLYHRLEITWSNAVVIVVAKVKKIVKSRSCFRSMTLLLRFSNPMIIRTIVIRCKRFYNCYYFCFKNWKKPSRRVSWGNTGELQAGITFSTTPISFFYFRTHVPLVVESLLLDFSTRRASEHIWRTILNFRRGDGTSLYNCLSQPLFN